MKKYKVIALSLGGVNKRIFEAGEIITQSQVEANVEDLVAQNFLIEADKDDEKKSKKDEKEKEEAELLAKMESEEAEKKRKDDEKKSK